MIKQVFILLLLQFLTCCTNSASNQIPSENSYRAKTQEAVQGTQEQKATIKNTKGVVVLSSHYGKNDFVRIYNADGSLWYEFTYFYDDSDGKFEYANDDFRPFAFHQDHFLLVLKCTERSDKVFEIVVNEETGMKKYVRAHDPVLRFETWENLVLNTFAVDFDKKENPVLEAPKGQVKRIDLTRKVTFHSLEIRGDWLRIRWNSKEGTTNKGSDSFGWIKWKNDETIVIDLHYFS